jgi:hypothetical protein
VRAQDGMMLHVESYKGNPAVINLPMKITVGVAEVDQAGNSGGTALLENGMKVRVSGAVGRLGAGAGAGACAQTCVAEIGATAACSCAQRAS